MVIRLYSLKPVSQKKFAISKIQDGSGNHLKNQRLTISSQWTDNFKKYGMVMSIGLLTPSQQIQESLALASMAWDDPPASSTAAASSIAASMRGKVGLEFET